MEGVNQYKDVTLTFYSPSGGTVTVQTDMPGGVLGASSRTLTIPVTSGERFTKTFPLDSPSLLEGKLIKFRGTSTGTLILYEGSLRFRRVGEYIDGTSGDRWETQPLSF